MHTLYGKKRLRRERVWSSLITCIHVVLDVVYTEYHYIVSGVQLLNKALDCKAKR